MVRIPSKNLKLKNYYRRLTGPKLYMKSFRIHKRFFLFILETFMRKIFSPHLPIKKEPDCAMSKNVGMYTKEHMTARNYWLMSQWRIGVHCSRVFSTSTKTWQRKLPPPQCRWQWERDFSSLILRPAFYHQFAHCSLLLTWTTGQFPIVAQSKGQMDTMTKAPVMEENGRGGP